MTKSIGLRSGQILARIVRVSPSSQGAYGCEVQTKEPAYRYTSVKEMIVPDSAPRKEKFIAQPSPQKESIVEEPPPQKEIIIEEPPPQLQVHVGAAKTSTAQGSMQTSAVAITICACVALSINYIASAVPFLG